MVATNCLLIGISSFFFFLLSLGTGIHMLKGFYSSWECDSYSMGTTSYKIITLERGKEVTRWICHPSKEDPASKNKIILMFL